MRSADHHLARRWAVSVQELVLVGLLLAACGAAPSGRGQTTPVARPEMVMVTLNDRGYIPSTIPLDTGQPVMLMVANLGGHPDSFDVTIPVMDIQYENAATAQLSLVARSARAVAVTVASGDELDVTFTPTRTGRYLVTIDLAFRTSRTAFGPPPELSGN